MPEYGLHSTELILFIIISQHLKHSQTTQCQSGLHTTELNLCDNNQLLEHLTKPQNAKMVCTVQNNTSNSDQTTQCQRAVCN